MHQLHQNRVKALREAYEAGMSLRVAAAHCGVAKGTVERYWRRWKSEDFGGEMACLVKGTTKRAWAAEAARREMSVRELHGLVLEAIAEDSLFEAVLE
jgi:transposase